MADADDDNDIVLCAPMKLLLVRAKEVKARVLGAAGVKARALDARARARADLAMFIFALEG